jgi:hypothetical protein
MLRICPRLPHCKRVVIVHREFPELIDSVLFNLSSLLALKSQSKCDHSIVTFNPYTYIPHLPIMAAFSTRINLLPTSRTLASGVPFAPRIALVHPPASHGHGTNGPRSDAPPKWTGSQGGYASNSRINSEYWSTTICHDFQRRRGGADRVRSD